jgi:glutathione S-transferase
MRLYYSPGACSLSPHIVLREAGRGFDLVRVDLKSHRTANGDDYYAINPKGYVPALDLDGEVLTEGPAIVQFIADLVPEQRLAPPAGTLARYRLQELLSFIATEIHKQLSWLFQPDLPAMIEERIRGRVAQRFAYLSDVLATSGHLMGETFTVADAYLFVMLRWCERFAIDLQIWPSLDAYYHRVVERDAVQAALVAEGLVERRARRIA